MSDIQERNSLAVRVLAGVASCYWRAGSATAPALPLGCAQQLCLGLWPAAVGPIRAGAWAQASQGNGAGPCSQWQKHAVQHAGSEVRAIIAGEYAITWFCEAAYCLRAVYVHTSARAHPS